MYDDVMVSLPLRDLLQLYSVIEDYPVLADSFKALEARCASYEHRYYELAILVGDLRKLVERGQP